MSDRVPSDAQWLWLSMPRCGRSYAPEQEVDYGARCPGAIAANAAIPARDIIEIGGDVAEAADSLLRVRRLIDNGLDSRLPEAAIKRRVLARIEEAMRQLGIVVAELRTVEGQP